MLTVPHRARPTDEAATYDSASSSNATMVLSDATAGAVAMLKLQTLLQAACSVVSKAIHEQLLSAKIHYTCIFLQGSMYNKGKCVPMRTLDSLAAVASASARLHLRDDVLPLPDVALAVLMLEERLQIWVTLSFIP